MELYKALCEISGEGNVLKDEPMKYFILKTPFYGKHIDL